MPKKYEDVLRRLDLIEEESTDVYKPQKITRIDSEELLVSPHIENSSEAEDEGRSLSALEIVLIVGLICLLILAGYYGYKFYKTSAIFNQAENKQLQSLLDSGVLMSKSVIPVDSILGNALVSAKVDSDGDGVSNAREIKFGTLPYMWDSDLDGLADNIELANSGLNPNGRQVKDRVNGIKSSGKSPEDLVFTKELDRSNIANVLGVPEGYIVKAVKVYNSLGYATLGGFNGAKTIVKYIPEINRFMVLRYETIGESIRVPMTGDYVVIGFSVKEGIVRRMINCIEGNYEGITREFLDDAYGVIDVNRVWGIDGFKTVDFKRRGKLPLLGVVDNIGYSSCIGTAWLEGVITNGGVPDVNSFKARQKGYTWVKTDNYDFDIWGVRLKEFEGGTLKLGTNRKIDVTSLKSPDGDFVRASLYLTSLALDKASEPITLKRFSTSESVPKDIVNSLQDGRVVLAIMANDKYVHGVLIYGLGSTTVDNDLYNFLCYDISIGKEQVLQVKVGNLQGRRYALYRYGLISDFDFDSARGDVFLFYNIRTDFTLEPIN